MNDQDDLQDQREREMLLSLAPMPGREHDPERRAALEVLELQHQSIQSKRERLAADADWLDD